MLCEIDNFDIDASFDDGSYKSCFARSILVNSQYQQTRGESFREKNNQSPTTKFINSTPVNTQKSTGWSPTVETSVIEGSPNLDFITSKGSSTPISRIAEVPVHNLVLKSQVETLQWQLKQTEASREMYRAVMKQVVTFLERAHRSLQILGSRIQQQPKTVTRTQSDFHIIKETADDTKPLNDSTLDYSAFRDFTWRRQKKQQVSPEEIPPEKLSQEAFRLLRTAQSLLNTREPNLVHEIEDKDRQFLEQVAKEFPVAENSLQTTAAVSLPFLSIDKDAQISTRFSRKLSLHGTTSECDQLKQAAKPSGSSTLEEDFNNDCRSSINSYKSVSSEKGKQFKYVAKSNSPPISTGSSAEDESGFSSMNSFQELGIPIITPLGSDDKTAKESLLRSMLHDDSSRKDAIKARDVKLWEQPNICHKRWSSTPDNCRNRGEKPQLKVLWV